VVKAMQLDQATYERSARALAERLHWPDDAIDDALAFEGRHPDYGAWWEREGPAAAGVAGPAWCVSLREGREKREFWGGTLSELEPKIFADEDQRQEEHEALMASYRESFRRAGMPGGAWVGE
jgi:hypothetical protein